MEKNLLLLSILFLIVFILQSCTTNIDVTSNINDGDNFGIVGNKNTGNTVGNKVTIKK